MTALRLVKPVLEGDRVVLEFEGGVRATLNDQFWAGLNYRYDESISGLVGYGFGPDNRFRVFYRIDAAKREVRVLAVGFKDRNRLFFGGKEFDA